MKENSQLSSKQIRTIVITTIIGIGILGLPSNIAKVMGNDGWIGILLGGLLLLPLVVIINRIFIIYPGKDFFEIGYEVLGKWIFNGFLILFLIYFILLSAFIIRYLGEIVKAFLLGITPIEVLIISFILVTTYIARSEINIIGRMSYHIYPIIIGFVIFLTLITLTGVNFTEMLPAFQSNFRDIPKGLWISFFSYSGFEILLFTLPFSEEKNKNMRSSLIGVGMVIAIYLIIFIISLSQYGLEQLQRQIFPTLALIKEVDLPGFFIENLEGVVMSIWILAIFATIGPVYYSTGKIISNLVKIKSHDIFILPLMPIIYIISLMPQNLIELNEKLGRLIDYLGLICIVFMPIFIYLVGYFKLRRKKV